MRKDYGVEVEIAGPAAMFARPDTGAARGCCFGWIGVLC